MSNIKAQLSSLAAGASVAVLTSIFIAKDALAQAVTPGGQAGFAIDPLEANVPIVDDTAVRDNLTNINVWVNSIFTILSGVALAYFIYNIIRFVLAKGPEDKAAAQSALGISFLGVLGIVGLWGAVAFVSSATGIQLGGSASRIST